MSKTSFILAIPRSFYSKKLYHQVGQTWRGRGFLYLLFLLAICWLSILSFFIIPLSQFATTEINYIVKQMPTIQIEQGKASIQKHTKPLLINSKTNGAPIAIIDVKNQYTDFTQSTATFLVQKESIKIKHAGNQIKTHHFNPTLTTTFGPKELEKALNSIKRWLVPGIFLVLYLVCVTLTYAYLIVQSLILAVIGTSFSKLSKQKLEFNNLINLSFVAMTPAIILSTIVASIRFIKIYAPIQYIFIYLFFLSLGYLVFAMKSQSDLPSS